MVLTVNLFTPGVLLRIVAANVLACCSAWMSSETQCFLFPPHPKPEHSCPLRLSPLCIILTSIPTSLFKFRGFGQGDCLTFICLCLEDNLQESFLSFRDLQGSNSGQQAGSNSLKQLRQLFVCVSSLLQTAMVRFCCVWVFLFGGWRKPGLGCLLPWHRHSTGFSHCQTFPSWHGRCLFSREGFIKYNHDRLREA